MGDTLRFDQGDKETLSGTLHDPQATPGDVLTVNADGSISAAPGGGSMPGAARWIGPHHAFANLLQTIDMTGDPPDDGTFTLTYDGNETAPIAWDADAAAVQAAIAALPGLDGPMQVTCYENNNFGVPAAFPAQVMAVVITNTPDRPLALAVGSNDLTASASPVAAPVVDFDATHDAYYCIAEISEGDIVDDVFVAVLESFADVGAQAGAYAEDGTFLFPANAYISLNVAPYIGQPFFTGWTSNGSAASAQMTDAGQSYQVIPTLALQNTDLFWAVKGRNEDDSVGEYKLFLRLATPSAS